MNGTGHARTALVLYGTETGTAQDLAEETARSAQRLHFDTDVASFDDVTAAQLSNYAATIFVIATTGQGDFPSNALVFWKSLLKKKLPRQFLHGVHYALAGLGDSSYPKYNWAARKLDKRLQQLGADPLLPICEADEQDDEGTEGAILPWMQELSMALVSKYPLPGDLKPIPPSYQLPSKWILAPGPQSVESSRQFSELSSTLPNHDHRPIAGALTAILDRNQRITPIEHWQDVRHLGLSVDEKVDFLPGDALAIIPKNFGADVDFLISHMNWGEVADQTIALRLNPFFRASHNSFPSPIPTLENHLGATLRTLLTDYLDITAIPRRSFFAAVARYTSNETQRERLIEFTESQFLDEYFDYTTRPRRSILEILQEFDSVQIPWQEVCNVFPLLRPRQFSIASGADLSSTGPGTAFELLVAVVKYRTVIKKIRQGVCTRYLAALAEGSTLKVVLRTEGRFKVDHNSSTRQNLLIGAGTGIAPLRALIHREKFVQAHRLESTSRTNILVFGARSKKADFFFQDEWDTMAAEDPRRFTLITAFSRDQREKIYIQDKIRANGKTIARVLQGIDVQVCVCGSSGAMPKAVRASLVDVLVQHALGDEIWTREHAEAFISALEKQGRYIQETW